MVVSCLDMTVSCHEMIVSCLDTKVFYWVLLMTDLGLIGILSIFFTAVNYCELVPLI